MLKVKDIMTKNVIACSSDTPIKEAARLMYLNGLTGMPVLDEKDKIVGIITEGDLVKLEGELHIPNLLGVLGSLVYLDNPLNGDEIEKQLKIMTATEVGKLMSKNVVSIASDAKVEEAAELFLHKKGNPIPVMEDGKLVGIVSRADIVKLIAGEKELREKEWKEIAKI
jgi:CBS domain-containing protein